jgi:hypothetical protein
MHRTVAILRPGFPRAAIPALAALLVAAGAGKAAAQESGVPPCAAPEHRQFDFWLGEWEVRTEDGQLAGTNRITKDFRDCVLREEWAGAGGGRGESLNLYDAAAGRWHQTWVDGQGRLLLLQGGLDTRRRMVLTGDRPGPGGSTVLNEISWEPRDDGSVLQVWSVSEDAGATWRELFRGIYTRREP